MAAASPSSEAGTAAVTSRPAAAASPRRRAKNALLYLFARGLLGLLALVPAAWLPLLLQQLGSWAAVLARRERARALRNLEASELGLRGRESRQIWRRVFANVGRSLGECLLLVRGGRHSRALQERVSFAPGSFEALQSALAQGQGVVIAGAHFGNWELLASVLARHMRLNLLARPSYDPRFSRLLEGMRARLGCRTIWVRGGRSHLRSCLAALSRGEAVALAVDQPPPADAERMAFLGRPAPTSVIAPALAHGSGAPLLLVLSEREGARHRVVVERIAVQGDLARGLAARNASLLLSEHLGRAVGRRPEQWLWSLDRWREERQ